MNQLRTLTKIIFSEWCVHIHEILWKLYFERKKKKKGKKLFRKKMKWKARTRASQPIYIGLDVFFILLSCKEWMLFVMEVLKVAISYFLLSFFYIISSKTVMRIRSRLVSSMYKVSYSNKTEMESYMSVYKFSYDPDERYSLNWRIALVEPHEAHMVQVDERKRDFFIYRILFFFLSASCVLASVAFML